MAIKHLKIIKSNGFTLIEMIAAMVLVAIIVPGMSLIVRGTLMNIAFTNIALQANMDADYAQRKFALHLDGISSFTNGTLNDTTLKFTSGFNSSTYEFQIRSATRSISYKKASGALGLLLQNVVVDTTINETNYKSKFVYKDQYNKTLTSPTNETIYGVELTFYLVRGDNSFYPYTTYVALDKNALNI